MRNLILKLYVSYTIRKWVLLDKIEKVAEQLGKVQTVSKRDSKCEE